MTKDLTVKSQKDAINKIADIMVVGNTDTFELISKASSESGKWMKSTKAMEIEGVGCVIQVSTQQDDSVAEALTFVPGVRIERTPIGIEVIKKIVPIECGKKLYKVPLGDTTDKDGNPKEQSVIISGDKIIE